MIRRFLLLVVAVVALAAPAGASAKATPLQNKLERALAVPHVNKSRTSALAVDLRTGAVVYERNRSRSLAPASTEKLPLSYALLVRLGPSYRIRTELLGRGRLEGSTWRGNLILKGYGDPTLDRWDLKAFAKQARALGIRRVQGAVLADESYFDSQRVGPGWKPSYFIYQSAPLSALVVERGRIGARTSTDPAVAAAKRLRKTLGEAGITVTGGSGRGVAPGSAQRLAHTSSPPLSRMLRAVNADSDNFTAEMLLKHLGAVERGRGTTGAGAQAVATVLAEVGIPLSGVRIADGSGLSLLDRLTAEALAGLLVVAWQDPAVRRVFLSTLAVSGQRGTLARRLREPRVAGRVVAKTGTTRISSSLAGYVDGRYAFAILHNGSPVPSWWARHAQDRFVKVLAKSR